MTVGFWPFCNYSARQFFAFVLFLDITDIGIAYSLYTLCLCTTKIAISKTHLVSGGAGDTGVTLDEARAGDSVLELGVGAP